MDRESRRRVLALCALLLTSAIQAVTPDASNLASSALFKLFTLFTQPAHHVFNENDRCEEVCREVRFAAPNEKAQEPDCTPTRLIAVSPPFLPSHDSWYGVPLNSPGRTGSARALLLSLCRLIC